MHKWNKIMVAILLVLLLPATVVYAGHSWNGNHWRSDNLSPTVIDKTSSVLFDVQAGVTEWAGLGTPIQPTLVGGNKGDIKVVEAFSPFWLGLARIFVEDGHITKAEVKLNAKLLEDYGLAAADHVLCQELGHVLGLDHSVANTCMNDDLTTLGDFPSPDGHDSEELIAIYNHTDATDGGDGDGGGGGGPPCDKNPNHPNCQPSNGVWIVIDIFPVPPD